MTTHEHHRAVLHAAYRAWMNAAGLRRARLRNKRFTYGDQWGDLMRSSDGSTMTEGEYFASRGCDLVTNNLIRQMVKTVVGRFRAQHLQQVEREASLEQVATANELDELDSRALEEFLISGCCIQRVDLHQEPGQAPAVQIDNVDVNRLIVNAVSDIRTRDCELVGQLHDLNLTDLLRRVAPGSRGKAAWVRKLYTEDAQQRTEALTAQLGADNQTGNDFWQARDGKCRAIEVWTLESREVLVCHNRREGTLTVAPANNWRRNKRNHTDNEPTCVGTSPRCGIAAGLVPWAMCWLSMTRHGDTAAIRLC